MSDDADPSDFQERYARNLARQKHTLERAGKAANLITQACKDLGNGFPQSARTNLLDAISHLQRGVEALDKDLDAELGIQTREEGDGA